MAVVDDGGFTFKRADVSFPHGPPTVDSQINRRRSQIFVVCPLPPGLKLLGAVIRQNLGGNTSEFYRIL